MAARKKTTKAPAKKSVKAPARKTASRSTSSRTKTSGLQPVHLVMLGVAAAIVIASFLFFQKSSSKIADTNLNSAVDVSKTSLDKEDIMEADEEGEDENKLSVALSAVEKSGQSGTVSVEDVDGKAVVSVSVFGSTESVQPAQIHFGSCEYLGDVKYPLTSLVDGRSKTTLDVSLQELQWGRPLAVSVQKSELDTETTVACGNL